MALSSMLSRTIGLAVLCLVMLGAFAQPAEALDRLRFQLNRGFFVVDLYEDTPQANQNMLNYINAGIQDGTFFHRLAVSDPNPNPIFDPFNSLYAGVDVIQGGGFEFNQQNEIVGLQTFAPINDDSEAIHPNEAYTIAMAENNRGYTSQWFINTLANPALDGNFTVFGTVTVGRDRIDSIFNNASILDLLPPTNPTDNQDPNNFDPFGAIPFEDLNTDGNTQINELIFVNVLYWIGDTDLDGDRDAADIDTLHANFGSFDPRFDIAVNAGATDKTDADALVRDIFETEYGDANLDGLVDIIDLDRLGQQFNQAGTWAQGDFNGDGLVDILDLDRLGQHFSLGSTAAPAVPEPATVALVGLAGLALLRRR